MNRAVFFQALGGGVAAVMGFKPIAAAAQLCRPAGRIIRYSTAPIADKEYEELLRGEVPESDEEQIKKDLECLAEFYKDQLKSRAPHYSHEGLEEWAKYLRDNLPRR